MKVQFAALLSLYAASVASAASANEDASQRLVSRLFRLITISHSRDWNLFYACALLPMDYLYNALHPFIAAPAHAFFFLNSVARSMSLYALFTYVSLHL